MNTLMTRLFISMAACLVAGIVTAALVIFLGALCYSELRNTTSPSVAASVTCAGAAIVIAVSAYCASTFMGVQTRGAGETCNDVSNALSILGTETASAIKGHPYQAAALALALGFTLGQKRGVRDIVMETILRSALR